MTEQQRVTRWPKSMAAKDDWMISQPPRDRRHRYRFGQKHNSGFSALPGGDRYSSAVFEYFGTMGTWWSDTEIDASSAWARSLSLCQFRF